ncbi:hypothetical protein DL771_007131 [Monosporascus sp. 5C6A]|nr:hypothetical protein DL771_007131 [Monosporascus sp. 5C6A]
MQLSSKDVKSLGEDTEHWRQTARCRHCSNNWNAIQALTTASEKVIALFEAASHAYTTGDYFTHKSSEASSGHLFSHTPDGASSSVTCTRAQMSLGDLVLQDDEANILAIQVIYKSLVTHYSLLEDLRDNQSSQTRDQTFGMDGASIQYTIDKLLRMLGRMHWEQDPLER